MTYIGATGHQNLPESSIDHIREQIRDVIRSSDVSRGYTCLAKGADQLVASELLAAGVKLHAVIPSQGYESTFETSDLAEYNELLNSAHEVKYCAFTEPSERAYWAAGQLIVDLSDRLIAVWDGAPSRGLGGTGDVVHYAQKQGKAITVIWPSGVRRK